MGITQLRLLKDRSIKSWFYRIWGITFIFRILTDRQMNMKGHCYTKSIILQTVFFKLRFTLSYRDIEEIMKIRGIQADRTTI